MSETVIPSIVEPVLPVVAVEDPDTDEFWQAAAENRLVYSACLQCDAAQFPPRGHCAACGGDCVTRDSAGVGEIVTWSRIHRAGKTGFASEVPYVVAIVALDEGFRMVSNAVPESEVAIGRRCKVTFRVSPATARVAPLFTLTEET